MASGCLTNSFRIKGIHSAQTFLQCPPYRLLTPSLASRLSARSRDNIPVHETISVDDDGVARQQRDASGETINMVARLYHNYMAKPDILQVPHLPLIHDDEKTQRTHAHGVPGIAPCLD